MPTLCLSPGAYLTKRREAAGLTIADVAEKVATEPRLAQHLRVEWIALIEADAMPAAFLTLVALRSCYPFDFGVLAALSELAIGAAATAPLICRECGCGAADTLSTAGSFWFVDGDLCVTCSAVTRRSVESAPGQAA